MQQWVPIAINLTVHVIMCKCPPYTIPRVVLDYVLINITNEDYYYFATAGGARIWVCVYLPSFSSHIFDRLCSGRSTLRPSRLCSSSSTCLLCTSQVSSQDFLCGVRG